MKAMILAAGLGTRLKPFTTNHPKALAEINGKTLLQRNIEYLSGYGIKDVIINVHHYADQITGLLKSKNNFGSNITISDESKELLETGGGLKKASWYFDNDEPLFLMNVDILTDMNLHKMLEFHNDSKNIATLAVCDRVTSRYFLFDQYSKLCGWRNLQLGKEIITRNANQYFQKAFSGIHIISPAIFPYLKAGAGSVHPEKFSIVDPYLEIIKDFDIGGFDHTGAKLIDVGKPESLEAAAKLFA